MIVVRRTAGLVLLALAMAGCANSRTAQVDSTSTSGPTPETIPATVAAFDSTTVAPTSKGVIVSAPQDNEPLRLVARIEEVLPHDAGAFTQGLVLRDGLFYESTGLYGQSTVRIVDPATGQVLSSVVLGEEYFGEGLEVVDDRIVQLTWREETAFIWDKNTLEPLGTYNYEGEGWGLCARDGQFYMSDGTPRLTVRDLESFEVIDTIDVRFEGEPVEFLNELECTESAIYANVWQSTTIVVIDPGTGFVVASIDATALQVLARSGADIDVLNGIAYDAATDTFYLTGKLWPQMFVVEFVRGG